MIHILFCGNQGVFDGMLTCALSIFRRSQLTEGITFHLMTMDVSHLNPNFVPIQPEQIAFFERVIQSYHPDNTVACYDVSDLYQQEFAGCPNEGAYCSPYTLIRLLADRIDALPDKLLYLDVDVMFNRDIHLLWDPRRHSSIWL